MVQTRATAAKNAETNADIKKKINILEEQYSTATEAHQKATDNVKRLQQQQEATRNNYHRLINLIVCERRPNKLVPMYRRRKNHQYRILTKISKELEKALKVENSAIEAMENAEAA